jgi:hypothetical protein
MNQFGNANLTAVQQRSAARANAPAAVKTIPFDYVFQFSLKGERNHRVQDVVEISMEGVFVALSVGYSLVLDERSTARTFQPVIDQRITAQGPVLVPNSPVTPPEGFHSILVVGTANAEVAVLLLHPPPVPIPFEGLPSPPPPPSIVGIGRIGPDGTVPMDLRFAIRSQGILRVWDRTNNLLGQLFEVNFDPGFETTPVIGPNPTTKRLPAAGDDRVHVYGSPSQTVDLFLLSSTAAAGTEIAVNQSFTLDATGIKEASLLPPGTKLSAGDALLVRGENVTNVPFSMFTIPRPRAVLDLTLRELEAGLEKSEADLTRGFRLNPNFAALATVDPPLDQQTAGTLGRAFETGAVAAEEASFRYSIDVVSTGRELQNKEIHNIAGLGIANGDRPFRPFAKPMMFEPRSSVRIQITEISGPPGTLFIVLQGYKMLGTGRIPG